jgi:hypothetical protein
MGASVNAQPVSPLCVSASVCLFVCHMRLLQAPDHGKFLKGLAVVDDVAYFGITTWAHR